CVVKDSNKFFLSLLTSRKLSCVTGFLDLLSRKIPARQLNRKTSYTEQGKTSTCSVQVSIGNPSYKSVWVELQVDLMRKG
uniref:Uncharacterized protein n=1 Tax=Cyprinodon variegatus TaxID=28743 RepID=A0A3Q2DRC7_CYPVA